MTTTEHVMLGEVVDDLAALLRADGATLVLVTTDSEQRSVELAVRFDNVECEECVLPPAQLREMIISALARRAGYAVDVVLHDPRAPEVQGAGGHSSDGATVEVLDPTGLAPEVGEVDPGPDAGPLGGKTVAIRQDILWRSFDWTVEEWTKELEAAGAKVLTWRRVQGLVGADHDRAQAELDAMLASAHVAISGLANCGSCTSWSARDALAGIERGLPTTAVATAHFEPLARQLAADGGRPGLRVVVLPYPYDTLPEDEVRAHARASFPQLLATLGASV
jgi:hypothetical protein